MGIDEPAVSDGTKPSRVSHPENSDQRLALDAVYLHVANLSEFALRLTRAVLRVKLVESYTVASS